MAAAAAEGGVGRGYVHCCCCWWANAWEARRSTADSKSLRDALFVIDEPKLIPLGTGRRPPPIIIAMDDDDARPRTGLWDGLGDMARGLTSRWGATVDTLGGERLELSSALREWFVTHM